MYHEEGLALRKKRRRKGAAGARVILPPLKGLEFPFLGVFSKLVRFVLKQFTGAEPPERGKDWHDTLTLSPEKAHHGAEVEYTHKKWGKPTNLMVNITPQ